MVKQFWYKLPFTGAPDPVVAAVTLEGVIAPESRTQRALNLEAVEKPLIKAFEVSGAKAVVLIINSPGGSPTQSRMIHDRVRELSATHKVPVITYIEDVGASGGYMIALSGEEIFADPFAIVGSIGVISAGFGFPETLKKLGVERRVYTSGTSKSQLDPFRDESPADVEKLEQILAKTHALFIDMVKDRRGGRLNGADDALFNGAFWVASDAEAHGLIDRQGDLRALLKERFGDNVKIQKIETGKKSLVAKLLGAKTQSSFDVSHLVAALDEISAWGRFGR